MTERKPVDFRRLGCRECLDGAALDFDISMAFQPILDLEHRRVFAHEALVRGAGGGPAASVFEHVGPHNQYRFDQTCRVKAIELASRLDLPGLLSINFMPNAVYRPESCIRTTLAAAEEFGFPTERIIFEMTETEQVEDLGHFKNIIEHYKAIGFQTAIDDFGSGFAGLNLLADFQTDLVKLDMALVQGIDHDGPRQSIVRGILRTASELGIAVVAEGVEAPGELAFLRAEGVHLVQGFLFARPGYECLPEIRWP